MLRKARLAAAISLVALALPARAARRLPPAADEALTSAEKLLGQKTGDDRSFACIDAVPFLKIVYRDVPDYAYSTGLYAECLFRTEDWAEAERMLEKYLSLVPLAARKGEVAQKVAKAEERLRACRIKLGHPLGDLPPPPGFHEEPKTIVVTPKVEPKAKPPPPTIAPAPGTRSTLPKMSDDFVLPPEPKKPAAPAAPARARQLVVRAGLSALAGGFGVSLEGRLGLVGLVVGTGGYPLAAGVTFSNPDGKGGPYASVHALWDRSSLLVRREESTIGLGATAGWDFRPLPRLSIQAGLGGGYDPFIGPLLAIDLCAGWVFPL